MSKPTDKAKQHPQIDETLNEEHLEENIAANPETTAKTPEPTQPQDNANPTHQPLEGIEEEIHLDHLQTLNTFTDVDSNFADADSQLSDTLAPTTPMSGPPPRTNRKFVAGYELLTELGRGGMGVVYRARQLSLNRLVALKMVLSGGQASDVEIQRFRIEAEAVASLHHPNIVQIFEVGEHDGQPFCSLELVTGGNLHDRMNKKPLTSKQAAELIHTLAQAMEVVHQKNLIHRDLKPANILLDGPKDAPLQECVPKITDFGLAKRLEGDSSQTRDGLIMGTPNYMAPEQAAGKVKEVGPKADIHALGAMLYEMLTGRPPFRGETLMDTIGQVLNTEPLPPKHLQLDVHHDLQTICLKCLEKDQEKRYQTAGELAEDLQRYLSNEPIHARPTPWWERAWKWTRRRPAVASLLLACLLFPTILAVVGLTYAQKEHSLRVEADQQKKRADENLQDARFAIEKLTQLGHRHLSKIPGMGAIRRELLEVSLQFHQKFLQINGNDPSQKFDVGLTNLKAAEIHEMLGDKAKAKEDYKRAIAQIQPLVEQSPKELKYKRELAKSWNDLAILYHSLKESDKANEAFVTALNIKNELVKAENTIEDRRSLINSYNGRGQFRIAQNLLNEAEEDFQAALKLLDEPTAKVAQEDLAITWLNLGTLRTKTKPEEASDAFDKALSLWQSMRDQFPTEPLYQQRIAEVHSKYGTVQQLLKANSEAKKHYEQSADILVKLVQKFPNVADHRRLLVTVWNNLGLLLRETRQFREAAQIWQGRISVLQGLNQLFPREWEYVAQLGRSHNELAMALALSGSTDNAVPIFKEALKLQSQLIINEPSQPTHWRDLLESRENLTALLRAVSRLKEAEDSGVQFVAVHQGRVSQFPAEVEYYKEWVKACQLLTEIFKERLKQREAAEMLLRNLAILQEAEISQEKLQQTLKDLAIDMIKQALQDDQLKKEQLLTDPLYAPIREHFQSKF